MNATRNQVPLLRMLLPFILGIIFSVYNDINHYFPNYLLGISIISYFILITVKKINNNYANRWISGLALHLVILFSGFCLTNLKIQDGKNDIPILTDKSSIIIGEIIELPLAKTNTIKVVLNIRKKKFNNNWININSTILTYLKKDSSSNNLKIGDVIIFKSQLKDILPPQNPNEFDYKKYLSYHHIHLQTFLKGKEWKKINHSSKNNIYRIADDFRKSLIKTLSIKGLDNKELAVASALILGYKNEIDSELKDAYSSAGAMHILAVSGLHVGVIFLIFNQLLSFLEKIRYGAFIKGLILILVLWSYAFLTGLSPSVMRAATMFSFIIGAKMTKRSSNLFNTISASAFTLLIFNPLLIMEVGFQLSYLAVIGIVVIQPWINDWTHIKWWLPRKIWEITAVSLAAQIATFPLGLLYFHQFPNYFILSNLIVIPLAFLILYLGLTALSLSFIPVISDYLALTLKLTIQLLNQTVLFIDKLPYALLENIRFNILDTWLIYLSIISIILLILYRKFIYFLCSASLIIVFFIFDTSLKYKNLQNKNLFIYNVPNHTVLNFIDGQENILLTNTEMKKKRKQLLFHVQNNWIKMGVNKEKIIFLNELHQEKEPTTVSNERSSNLFITKNYCQFYNLKIAFVNHHTKIFPAQKKINLDLLIITDNTRLKLAELLTVFSPKQIIIDSSNSIITSKKIMKEAEQLGINCWSILLNGYFSIKA